MRARPRAARALAVLLAAGFAAASLGAAPAVAVPACVDAPVKVCLSAGGPEVGGVGDNTNDYPSVRSTEFVRIRFGGVSSPQGGVIAMEPGLYGQGLNGNLTYAPCKGRPTVVTAVDDPVNGGEPYKPACADPVNPSYYRSGGFSAGLQKQAAEFAGGIVMTNTDSTAGCTPLCNHQWANKLSRLDVEIYLKKRDPKTGALSTDFEYVRPRFSATAFTARAGNGLESADFGVITPLRAYDKGTARLQGLIYASGSTRAAPGRVRFSVFETDAKGHTSTGQPLQAFSVFTSTGAFYSLGTLYAGNYKMRLTDFDKGTCVVVKHLPLLRMDNRIDLHLDRPGFGLPHARTVAC
ncbi:MAG: hypothetical protein LC789_08815 [Actinobacteria bacterium]|nr:hypothetical protein [Actinomycetota bacterium]MCA1720633.1 hypothetical protein [Actinomycetota bacterium]